MDAEDKWSYYDDEEGWIDITTAELQMADEEIQCQVMVSWFKSNYTNPMDEGHPIDDETGDFYFFYGGPYEPDYELATEFEGIPEEVIRKAAYRLADECHVWDGTDEYDEDYLDTIRTNTAFLDTFHSSIRDVRILADEQVDLFALDTFYRMLFANIITAMETYFSDAFINTLLTDKKYIRRFIEVNKDYEKELVEYRKIFELVDSSQSKVQNTLLNSIMWHNVNKVLELYYETFGIKSTVDRGPILIAVKKRHDIVHRNGKSNDGTMFIPVKQDVLDLAEKMEIFVADIDAQLHGLEGLKHTKLRS